MTHQHSNRDSDHHASTEQETLVEMFAFLNSENWFEELSERLDLQSAEFYKKELQPAEKNELGHCIDERPVKEVTGMENRPLKPAFVGGASGWIVLFMAFGQSREEATNSTQELYNQVGWKTMEFHIDDEHGHIDDEEELAHRESGCGFLGVATNVVESMKQIFAGRFDLQSAQVDGSAIIREARLAGDTVVPLAGDHKNANYEAKVVVNTVPGTTLDRGALYAENPAFLWDAWATTGDSLRGFFNELAGQELSADDFFRLQAALHLVTGKALNAVSFDEDSKNVVVVH